MTLAAPTLPRWPPAFPSHRLHATTHHHPQGHDRALGTGPSVFPHPLTCWSPYE